MIFDFIVSIFSSFIDFLPPPTCASHLAAPFPDFHGFSPSPMSSRLDKPAHFSDFETTLQLSPDFLTTSRLPSDFLRPTKSVLKCFRNYWAFASSSRQVDGLALQLTPCSLSLYMLRSSMCVGPLWGPWAHRFPSKICIIAAIPELFCSRPTHDRKFLSNFSILFPGPCPAGCLFSLIVTRFSPSNFFLMLLHYTRTCVLVYWGFVGACVFCSSSSDARDPVVVVVCLGGFV